MGVKLEFLGAESLGVRSLATFVETPDVRMILDAGAALGFRDYLLPHPLEYRALKETKDRIIKYARKADFVIISHYHFDHYIATWKEVDAKWTWSSYKQAKLVYEGKVVYAKSFRKDINVSQRKRGYLFSKISSDFCKQIVYADNTSYQFGKTRLVFSPPLLHGDDASKLGYVMGTLISHEGKKLLHCADIQGPSSQTTLEFIMKVKPDYLVLSGPPIYLSGYKIQPDIIEQGLENLKKIVKCVKQTIVDHHLLRSEDGVAVIEKLKSEAKKKGNKVSNVAEYMGKESYMLECRRKKLYEEFPPDSDFMKWLALRPAKQSVTCPPI